MNTSKAYQYFYYKIFKSLQSTNDTKFLLDWKAAFIVDCLELAFCFSLIAYYNVFSKTPIIFEGKIGLVLFIYIFIIGVPNYFVFQHNDRWKGIIKEFDKLPKHKNAKDGIMVWIIVALVIVNFIFSFYLLFNKAEKNHTGPYSIEYLEHQKQNNSN